LPARKVQPDFNVKNLVVLRKILETIKYPVADDEPPQGYDGFCVNDPFGNRIDFLEPK
jgi:hypothetical protein